MPVSESRLTDVSREKFAANKIYIACKRPMTIHAALDRASSYVLICFDRQKCFYIQA